MSDQRTVVDRSAEPIAGSSSRGYDDRGDYHRRGRGHYDRGYQRRDQRDRRDFVDRPRRSSSRGYSPPRNDRRSYDRRSRSPYRRDGPYRRDDRRSGSRPGSRSPPRAGSRSADRDGSRSASHSKSGSNAGGSVKAASAVAALLKQLNGGNIAAAAASSMRLPSSGSASGRGADAAANLLDGGILDGVGNNPAAAMARIQASAALGGGAMSDKIKRELYIGNLPEGIQPPQVKEFFNSAMLAMNSAGGYGDPVRSVRFESSQRFCFVEFRSADDASAATALDGISLYGNPLKVGRPRAYMQLTAAMAASAPSSEASTAAAPAGAAATVAALASLAGRRPDVKPGMGPESNEVLRISGLKAEYGASVVRDLLTPFGAVVKCDEVEAEDGEHGMAVLAVLGDTAMHPVVAKELNGLDVGGASLVIRALGGVSAQAPAADTCFVQLDSILTLALLSDSEEVAEILGEVKEECQGMGTVQEVAIGAVDTSAGPAASVPLLVHFAEPSAAAKCVQVMKGRKFDERSIGAKCIEEHEFLESKGQVAPAPDAVADSPVDSAAAPADASAAATADAAAPGDDDTTAPAAQMQAAPAISAESGVDAEMDCDLD